MLLHKLLRSIVVPNKLLKPDLGEVAAFLQKIQKSSHLTQTD